MIAWWMTQSLMVGAWMAAGAMLLEIALRRLGKPVRLVWCGSLVALLGVFAWTIARPDTPTTVATAPLPSAVVAAGSSPAAEPVSVWRTIAVVPRSLMRSAGAAAVRLESEHGLAPWLAGGWIALSGLTALGLFGLHLRLAMRRRRWAPCGHEDGVPVRMAQHEGPFVFGVAPAEIVLPAWAAALPPEGRALIVAHEREHVRGGDPWMLALANAVVVALPWHPVAWWMHARLRLAAELDCDRRCLAAGIDAGTYGRLLLTAADHTQSRLPWRAVAPAFATRRSHLEQRLLAMTNATRRPRRPLALTALVAATVVAVAACESAAPTAAEVAAADATTVRARLALGVADSNVTYMVNGKVVSAEEAKRVEAKDIKTIAVAKRTDGAQVKIEITDNRSAAEWKSSMDYKPEESATMALDRALIVIDGVVQASPEALNALKPDRIANVEILKGPAARALYDVAKYPNAANGVVKITTKP